MKNLTGFTNQAAQVAARVDPFQTIQRGIMEHVYCCTGHELKIPNIVDSQGVYLFDDKKKRYMDLESGVWCTSIGHKNERINGAIMKQI